MSRNEVIVLNVGGRQFTTKVATLTSPTGYGSMLASLVALQLQQQDAAQGGPAGGAEATLLQPALADPRFPEALFIDRDGTLFHYILNYLRDGGQLELPGDLHTTRQLLREAKYYQLPGLETLLEEHARALLQAQQRAHEITSRLEGLEVQVGKVGKVLNEAYPHLEKLDRLESLEVNLEALRKYMAPSKAVYIYGTPTHGPLLRDLEVLLATFLRYR